ncbi:GAF domain-containing protein [Streptomyces sp. ODS28]|uniref:GAF domain-containing sensor histidine kinase n=1 Tax=Streptomyces sp. ODS28 TaxID=3136688 RepID=UPI0031F1B148
MSEDCAVGGATGVPRLRLDELLEEMERRIRSVRGTQDRLHGLLEAVLSIGRGLEVSQVLRQIVEAAVVLVDAEYGALGVVGEEQELAQFLTVGVSEEQRAVIGDLPRGHGILGELIRHPEPLRLSELSEHPASYGFPPNHPPMHSFLGVPIRVRDEVFGNFYLTEKRGAKEFDAEDEAVLSTLAVAAGVAIENAQLYEEARRRERWAAAGGEVTAALLSGAPRGDVLELIVRHAMDGVRADLGVVAVPVEGGGGLRTGRALGLGAEAHQGITLPRQDGFMSAAFRTSEPVTSADIQHDGRVAGEPHLWQGLGPAVAVPMRTGGEARGVLALARAVGSLPFTEGETGALRAFVGQVALAMEVAERRRDAEQLALLEERDRIARDLHDLAIQRLFATGMTLQSAQRLTGHPELSERLARAVSDLDTTIKIIRSTIFGLRSHEAGESTGLRSRVAAAVGEAAGMLGFPPALRVEGLVETEVSGQVADHVTAVLKEALSNVARHAKASSVDVHLAVSGGELTLTVTDDGRGIPEPGHRSGLKNLAERARQCGGTFEVGPADGAVGGSAGGTAGGGSADGGGAGAGTRLVWRAPALGGSGPEDPA